MNATEVGARSGPLWGRSHLDMPRTGARLPGERLHPLSAVKLRGDLHEALSGI